MNRLTPKSLGLGLAFVLALSLSLTWACAPALAAQKKADAAAEALEGFDEPPAATSKPTKANEALEGFEDETAPKQGRQPGGQVGEVLTGFDDESETKPAEKSAFNPRAWLKGPWWQISGAATASANLNYAHDAPPPGGVDHRGLSRLRGELELKLELKLPHKWRAETSWRGFYNAAYLIRGRDDFPGTLLDEYETESEIREAFVRGKALQNLDLKLGRQLVVWGKSDNVRVVDVINPLDLREPGMVDIEDLRLPVTMARADYYFGRWSLTGLVIPEPRFDKLPAFGSDFYPAAITPPHLDRPGVGLDNLQYALALSGVMSGWDISFHAARIFNHQPYFELVTGAGGIPSLERRYAKLWMAGLAANVALGNWLLKSEAAWLDGFEFYALPGQTKSRFDFMAGAEYSGLTDTTVSLEWVVRYIPDYDQAISGGLDNQDRTVFNSILRYTQTFVNEKYKFTGLVSLYGLTFQGGGFVRLQLDYDLADGWTLSGGVIDYLGGSQMPFGRYQDNDRLFASLKYSF